MHKQQKGFSTIEVLLVAVIIAIIGFALWRVYGSHKNTTKPAVNTTPTKTVKQSTDFDPVKDGKATNFKVYQTFGGKYGVASKAMTYNVFLPTGFGFDTKTDRLQLLYTLGTAQKLADDTGDKSNKACQTVSNGINCSVTWVFDEATLKEAEYRIDFKVLDNTTHQKGRIFVDITNDIKGEGGATVFIKKPLTTPYVSFSSPNDTTTLSDKTQVADLPIIVKINSEYTTSSMELNIDGKLYQNIEKDKAIASDDQQYTGGKTSLYKFTIKKDDLLALMNGEHALTAVAKVDSFSEQAVNSHDLPGLTLKISF